MTENKLFDFGFRPFEHLNRLERDGKKRMIYITSLEDHFLIVRLVCVDNQWKVDLIKYDGRPEILEKYFPPAATLSEILVGLFPDQLDDTTNGGINGTHEI